MVAKAGVVLVRGLETFVGCLPRILLLGARVPVIARGRSAVEAVILEARITTLVKFGPTEFFTTVMMSVDRLIGVVLLIAVVFDVAVAMVATPALMLRTGGLAISIVRNLASIVELMILGEASTHLFEVDVLLIATATTVHAFVLVMWTCAEAALNTHRHSFFASIINVTADTPAI